jgi:hypothetical protein
MEAVRTLVQGLQLGGQPEGVLALLDALATKA